MKSNKKEKSNTVSKVKDFEITLAQLNDKGKFDKVRAYIKERSAKQSEEQLLLNELASIKYKIYDYIESNNTVNEMHIIDFVKLYIKALKITQKTIAEVFGLKGGNLYKYLVGDRKLNDDLVLKLSSFFHTEPELWYRIELKNQIEHMKRNSNIQQYQKYDCIELVSKR